MRLDLHIHSAHSPDGRAAPRDILRAARKRKLDGLCIADHNSLKGSLEAARLARDHGVVVVRGTEISADGGHILAYGIAEEVRRGLSPVETVERIHSLGGLAVVAHPYRWWSGLGKRATVECKPDALEVHNSRSSRAHNERALRLSRKMGVPGTAGSDAHTLAYVGKAYIIIDEQVETEEQVMEAIRKGCRTGGDHRSMGESLRYGRKAISQWMKRGFHRI